MASKTQASEKVQEYFFAHLHLRNHSQLIVRGFFQKGTQAADKLTDKLRSLNYNLALRTIQFFGMV